MATDRPRPVLLCPACGRADRPSVADLLRYTRAGWPRCCGQVMVLADAEADRPGPGLDPGRTGPTD